MALTRDTPLLTTKAEVVAQTAVQDLASLESDAEFSTAATLLTAHEWVFDRLRKRLPTGALASVSNSEELKRAVAFRFLEIVGAAGYLGAEAAAAAATDGGYWGKQAREEVDLFQPIYADGGDTPRDTTEGVPVVRNVSRRPLFGGQLS